MIRMQQTMRWYGEQDVVSLRDIRQAGCTGVVTALHQIPVGEIWPQAEIAKRKQLIEEQGLTWQVIESLPVHEDIKIRKGDFWKWIENYKVNLHNVASSGLRVVTYNFMPVLDWLRTDPQYKLENGSRALYFERIAFIAFDLFLLKRPDAEKDYSHAEIQLAKAHLLGMNTQEKEVLFKNVLLGLPGSDIPFRPAEVLAALKTYQDIDRQTLKNNLYTFLNEVVPVAESLGLLMAIHPDDPPFSVLGLPRIMSTEADAKELFERIPSLANGLCFCTGSFGVRADNDILKMIRHFGERIHFLHLRNTKRDGEGNFYEANHLDGDVDMANVVMEILKIMNQQTGRAIPMRPDHGHQMLDDLKKTSYPGYSAIGRLKGLAELRGLEEGLIHLYSDL